MECEVCVDGVRLEHVSKFVLDESGTNEAEVLQVLLGFWLMSRVCSLSVLGSFKSHCSCLFLCLVVKQ